MDVELRTATGMTHLDDLLRGLISLFEIAFPARIRSYYLVGSYSDGTAVGYDASPNSSDIDLSLIFRGTVKETESETFHRLVTACRRISPIQIDAQAYSEIDLLQHPRAESKQTSFTNVQLKIASMLIYGDDLRDELSSMPFPCYVLDVIESGIFHVGIPRQKEGLAFPLVTPLVPPLTYPNPDGEFYGYDVVPARPDAPRGMRVLVALTSWIATLILTLETGHYSGQKSQTLQICKAYLPNDKRTQLAVTINDLCKGAWGYVLPGNAEDRMLLRGLCRETLALENEYLRITHDYVLAQLQRGGVQEKRQAMRILQNVLYQDSEIMAALKALMHDKDEAVQTGAAKALEIAEHST